MLTERQKDTQLWMMWENFSALYVDESTTEKQKNMIWWMNGKKVCFTSNSEGLFISGLVPQWFHSSFLLVICLEGCTSSTRSETFPSFPPRTTVRFSLSNSTSIPAAASHMTLKRRHWIFPVWLLSLRRNGCYENSEQTGFLWCIDWQKETLLQLIIPFKSLTNDTTIPE